MSEARPHAPLCDLIDLVATSSTWWRPGQPHAQTPRLHRRGGVAGSLMAVALGFEPRVAMNHTDFRDLHLRPLGHATSGVEGTRPRASRPTGLLCDLPHSPPRRDRSKWRSRPVREPVSVAFSTGLDERGASGGRSQEAGISRSTAAGTPPTTTPAGTSRVTTAPAAMTDPSPTVTPLVMTALAPTHTSSPSRMGAG